MSIITTIIQLLLGLVGLGNKIADAKKTAAEQATSQKIQELADDKAVIAGAAASSAVQGSVSARSTDDLRQEALKQASSE